MCLEQQHSSVTKLKMLSTTISYY